MRRPDGDVEQERGIVAGLLVRSRHPLPGLPTAGYHDGEVRVRVVERSGSGSGGWVDVPSTGPVAVRSRADGVELEAAPVGVRPEDLATAVRAAAPFAAALQARVTLHAVGVALGASIAAIVGASGSGKSTLAESLRKAGLPVVADDLLACRVSANEVVAPAPAGDSGRYRLEPLAGVFFLARVPGLAGPRIERLDGLSCFRLLVRHGFGEIGEAPAWSAQVDLYHLIAARVPAFEMEIPDDSRRVDEMARWFEAVCRRQLG